MSAHVQSFEKFRCKSSDWTLASISYFSVSFASLFVMTIYLNLIRCWKENRPFIAISIFIFLLQKQSHILKTYTRNEKMLLNHIHYHVSMKNLYANCEKKEKKNTFSHFVHNINVWMFIYRKIPAQYDNRKRIEAEKTIRWQVG